MFFIQKKLKMKELEDGRQEIKFSRLTAILLKEDLM